MAADPGIYNLIRPVAPPPDPMEMYGKAGALRLQDLHTQKLSSDLAEEQAVKDLFSSGKMPTVAELYGVSPSRAGPYQKSQMEMQKTQAELLQHDSELVKSWQEESKLSLQTMTPENWPAYREQQIRRADMLSTPQYRNAAAEHFKQMPTQFDPNYISAALAKGEDFQQKNVPINLGDRTVMAQTQARAPGFTPGPFEHGVSPNTLAEMFKPQLVETPGGYNWATPPGQRRTGPPYAAGAVGLPTPQQPTLPATTVPAPGLGPTGKGLSAAAEMRGEQEKALKPLDEVQQGITRMKQLLATGGPAAAQQIQEGLTNIFDKNRAYSSLLGMNRNFGDLQGRASGFFGRAFTGQYTEEQRRQIKEMLDDMEKNVITPSRQRIIKYPGGIAESAGVPNALIPTPPGYADQAWSVVK